MNIEELGATVATLIGALLFAFRFSISVFNRWREVNETLKRIEIEQKDNKAASTSNDLTIIQLSELLDTTTNKLTKTEEQLRKTSSELETAQRAVESQASTNRRQQKQIETMQKEHKESLASIEERFDKRIDELNAQIVALVETNQKLESENKDLRGSLLRTEGRNSGILFTLEFLGLRELVSSVGVNYFDELKSKAASVTAQKNDILDSSKQAVKNKE